MAQVMAPRQRGSALGRAAGVAGIIGSVVGAVPTGGASLAGLPGSLAAARGPMPSPQGLGGKVASPGQRQDPLQSLNVVGGLVNAGMDAKKMGGNSAMQRQMASQSPQMKDADILATLGRGEKALNEIRAQNPELAKQYDVEVLSAIMEAHRRYTQYGTLRPQGVV